ncbi:MAG: hypothetical protein ACN0LA_07985 [Candidatus Longimicrobiales bacterium M2_2A_002]
MTDPIIERAIAILRSSACVALPLDELAARVGTVDPDGLARRIAADPRLILVEPVSLPGLELLSADRETAYDRALREAGLRGGRRVALRARRASPGAGVSALLLETAARLLSPGPEADVLARAADRAYRAVTATLPAGPAPSTTRPPGPPTPPPVRRRTRRPAARRPPRP